MLQVRRIIFLVYPGFDLLTLGGPVSVFTTANRLHDEERYKIVIASSEGGAICAQGSVPVTTVSTRSLRIQRSDTVFVVSGPMPTIHLAMEDLVLLSALQRASVRAERYGSVCAGTFILAAAGIIKTKKVATHWGGCAKLGESFEDVHVEHDALFVNDGRLWTSAGVATGIDMTLIIIGKDISKNLMRKVAKELVVYMRRPGHLSQFSDLLDTNFPCDDAFKILTQWLEQRLGQSIKVADMAKKVGMSERSFSRKFSQTYAMPPAKYLERRRLERSKKYLESGLQIKEIIGKVGFKSDSAFRTAFRLRFGITPSLYSGLHK